ncbi:MAG TPA: hypothetical protein VD768_03935 [Sphingomicrobium sp.]|nr:hypothetical protein [Sphingomicrobium sp.]
MRGRLANGAVWAVLLIAVSPLAAPKLLAFPYAETIGAHAVYSEKPIGADLKDIVTSADRLVALSAIGSARPANQPIYLTDGGWRWIWLSGLGNKAFAVSRPVVETIVVNRSDAKRDLVSNGRPIAGNRGLHGTIAHEMTHGSIRAHFGILADLRYPAALREGYADFVAGGGSLTDAEAQALERTGRAVPALDYWRGRKQVEAALAKNGGSVDALFRDWD